MRCHEPPRCARLMAWPGRAGEDTIRCVMKCHVVSCDVIFRRRPAPLHQPRRSAARPNPACRSCFAFRSVRAAAGLPAARPFFARIACARAPAFAPARGGRRSGLRMPLPPDPSYHSSTGVKPLPRIISYFMNKLLPPGGNAGTCHAMSCSAAPPASALSQCQPTTLSPISSPRRTRRSNGRMRTPPRLSPVRRRACSDGGGCGRETAAPPHRNRPSKESPPPCRTSNAGAGL